jgi:hypothetical protein
MMAGMITLILIGLLREIRTHRALVLENLALRHQLAVLQLPRRAYACGGPTGCSGSCCPACGPRGSSVCLRLASVAPQGVSLGAKAQLP